MADHAPDLSVDSQLRDLRHRADEDFVAPPVAHETGRPAAAPGILVDHPRIAGGRDLLAGGTWMVVAADGRVAAVTNRRSEMRDPSRRSRGELPLATLAAGDDAGMRHRVEGLDTPAY